MQSTTKSAVADACGHHWRLAAVVIAGAGAPRTVTDKLQRALNAAARVITGTRKFDDRGLGQILHDQLHWLDVPDRVLSKLAVTVHHRICRSTASRSPVLTRGGICVPPTVTYLPYRVSGSTLTAVGRSQLRYTNPLTHSQVLAG